MSKWDLTGFYLKCIVYIHNQLLVIKHQLPQLYAIMIGYFCEINNTFEPVLVPTFLKWQSVMLKMTFSDTQSTHAHLPQYDF